MVLERIELWLGDVGEYLAENRVFRFLLRRCRAWQGAAENAREVDEKTVGAWQTRRKYPRSYFRLLLVGVECQLGNVAVVRPYEHVVRTSNGHDRAVYPATSCPGEDVSRFEAASV